MNVFSHARKKIHEEHCFRHDYAVANIKKLEQYDLEYINFCEAQSKQGIKASLVYSYRAFVKALYVTLTTEKVK